MFSCFDAESSLITQLLNWAKNGPEPLQSYATGLLPNIMKQLQKMEGNSPQTLNFPISLTNLASLKLKILSDIQKRNTIAYKENIVVTEGSSKFVSDQPSASDSLSARKRTITG